MNGRGAKLATTPAGDVIMIEILSSPQCSELMQAPRRLECVSEW